MADPPPTLDRLFTKYSIQTEIMTHLNFFDFRNLRLAGCQVPVNSRAVQKKYLIPVHCHEFRRTFDSSVQCDNTPPDVDMRPCQGLSLDRRPGDPGQNFDDRTISHLHNGRDKSQCFWVCSECRDRSEARYQRIANFTDLSYASLCQTHSREHRGFPSNSCRCTTTAIGDWRCSMCILTSLEILGVRAHDLRCTIPLRVTLLGILPVTVRPDMEWTAWVLRHAQTCLNKFIPWRHMVKSSRMCPVENCKEAGWESLRSMKMCLQCRAIWPTSRVTPWSAT